MQTSEASLTTAEPMDMKLIYGKMASSCILEAIPHQQKQLLHLTLQRFYRFRGAAAELNHNMRKYQPFIQDLQRHTTEEIVAGLRRHSKGQVVQSSAFKGVSRHQKVRWESRIGGMPGRLNLPPLLATYQEKSNMAAGYVLQAIGTSTWAYTILSSKQLSLTTELPSPAVALRQSPTSISAPTWTVEPRTGV